VNFGVPGVAVGYGYGNPCYRPYWYRPAWCGGYSVYGAPLFVDGGWYRGPVYSRYYGGARYFWIHNRWTADRDDFHRGYDGWYRGRNWSTDQGHDHDRWQDDRASGEHDGGDVNHGGWHR